MMALKITKHERVSLVIINIKFEYSASWELKDRYKH